MYIEMVWINRKEKVRVYKIFENKTALVWSDKHAGDRNGHGWDILAIKNLMPVDKHEEYFGEFTNFLSKSERNSIKSRLELVSTIWKCTDGKEFEILDEAIAHEKILRDAEKEAEEE